MDNIKFPNQFSQHKTNTIRHHSKSLSLQGSPFLFKAWFIVYLSNHVKSKVRTTVSECFEVHGLCL